MVNMANIIPDVSITIVTNVKAHLCVQCEFSVTGLPPLGLLNIKCKMKKKK